MPGNHLQIFKLLKKYGRRSKKALPLNSQAGGKGRSTGKVGKDYRLRELDRKGKKVKVRDLFGREGWVDNEDLY